MRHPRTVATLTRPLSQGRTDRVVHKSWQSYASLLNASSALAATPDRGVMDHA